VSDASGYEHGFITLTVTRNGTATGSHAVSYSTSNGSATAGVDYVAKSGVLSFSSTETTRRISIQAIYDQVSDPNETFTVTLSSPTGGATIHVGTATGTIVELQ
jgi:chitinase